MLEGCLADRAKQYRAVDGTACGTTAAAEEDGLDEDVDAVMFSVVLLQEPPWRRREAAFVS